MNVDKQEENKKMKKKKLDREEYGYGYDLSVDELNTVGQNESAKTNESQAPNHPVSNDNK